jgi:hypothetical protein
LKINASSVTISTIVFLLILGLWIVGIIPQQIGRMTAVSHVQKFHKDRELIFVRMDFSSAHGDYFAVFKDSNGEIYNFQMHSKLLPITVRYDPFNLVK